MSWREWLGLTPTEADLMRRVLAEAARNGEDGWEYIPDERALKHSGTNASINCTNIYLEYINTPARSRKELVYKYASLLQAHRQEVPGLWTLAAKNIYPGVRSRHMLVTVQIDTRATPHQFPPIVRKSYVGDLQILLLYDYGQQTGTVSEEKAEVWSQPTEELFTRAIANLRSLPRPKWVQEDHDLYRLESEAGYQESFLLVPEVLQALPVAGDPILTVPNRGVLLAAGSDSPQAIRSLIQHSRNSLTNAPWPLSGLILRSTPAGLVPFEPDPDCLEAVQALDRLNLCSVYDAQKQSLDRYYERIGEDRFVATFSLISPKGEPDSIRSWCSWAENVPSLLPRTDLVAFSRGAKTSDRSTALVSWEAATSICSEYMQPTDEDPQRFRVDGFPSEEQWRRLQALAERPS